MSKASTIAELIRSRRTIHTFKPEQPPRALIMQAIDLARWAPNHRLTEPWRFYLLGSETAEAIVRLNAHRVSQARGAEAGRAKLKRWSSVPGWIVVTYCNSDDPIRAREDYAACCCAVHNFSLFLWTQGIGVKWSTGEVTRDPRFYDLLGVDATAETVVAMLWYGYPAQIPQINRKAVSQFTVELP